MEKTSDTTQANRKFKSLTCSREAKKRRTSLTSGDALEDTLRALKSTSLAARASKLGTNTLKNLWRLNNPFVSDSVELQQAYKQELMSTFGKTDGEAWTAIAHTVAQSLQPHLRRMEGVDGASYVVCWKETVRRGCRQPRSPAARPSARCRPLDGQAPRPVLCCQGIIAAREEAVVLCLWQPKRFQPYTLLATLQSGPTRPVNLLTLRDCVPHLQPPPAALAVAYESLRLYPPIRRVRRDRQVDIEAIQRDPKYWGPTAGGYDPSRFLDKNGEIKGSLIGPGSAWMPFAVGTMKCPSAGGYSARLILVIVGEVFRQLFLDDCPPHWHLDGPEWDTSAKNGNTLRAGRDEYASVRVVVTSPSRNI